MDQITCSAGKGVLSTEECLKCALNAPAPCGYDYVVLKALYSDNNRTGIHVTDVLGCPLKAYWDRKQETPEMPHQMLVRALGTAVHHFVETSDEIVEGEVYVEDEELGLVGTADIVYDDGRLVDIKTTRWLMPAKVPYGTHALQVNVYAMLFRKSGREVNRLQIQYIDMSGPTKCKSCRRMYVMKDNIAQCPECGKYNGGHLGALLVDVPIMTDDEIMGYIKENLDTLAMAYSMDIAPEPQPGYLCEDYCSHRYKCPAFL